MAVDRARVGSAVVVSVLVAIVALAKGCGGSAMVDWALAASVACANGARWGGDG